MPFDPPTVTLPPCGRRECPRQGVVEHGRYHCLTCNSTAPIPPTIFDGFIKSQIRQFQHKLAVAPGDDPGITGTKGAPSS